MYLFKFYSGVLQAELCHKKCCSISGDVQKAVLLISALAFGKNTKSNVSGMSWLNCGHLSLPLPRTPLQFLTLASHVLPSTKGKRYHFEGHHPLRERKRYTHEEEEEQYHFSREYNTNLERNEEKKRVAHIVLYFGGHLHLAFLVSFIFLYVIWF